MLCCRPFPSIVSSPSGAAAAPSTLYFHETEDTDWDNGENWFEDAAGTIPWGVVPTASQDAVIQSGVCDTNGTCASLVVAGTGTLTSNTGTVTTNNGTVTTNTGTIFTNTGTVTTNNGMVITNDGTVTTNNGTVSTNNLGATITDHNSGATVGTNTGLIVNANSGSIITNEGSGTITNDNR